MKKLFLSVIVLPAIISCEPEGLERVSGARSGSECYLSAVTASNLGTYGYVMEDGKLTSISYDGFASTATYIYDDDGKLERITGGNLDVFYFYNSNDRVIRVENHHEGLIVSKTEYVYTQGGTLKKSLYTGNMEGDVQSFSETEYEYQGGNPVKQTTYLYSSIRPKGEPLVMITKFDTKRSAYATLGSYQLIEVKNNPIEIRYPGSPEQDTDIEYTYNSDGFPVTYVQKAINRPEYPDVSGTYEYTCE